MKFYQNIEYQPSNLPLSDRILLLDKLYISLLISVLSHVEGVESVATSLQPATVIGFEQLIYPLLQAM